MPDLPRRAVLIGGAAVAPLVACSTSNKLPATSERLGRMSAPADLRDWNGISEWKSTLGAQYTHGKNTLRNQEIAFNKSDIGKVVIVSEEHVAEAYTRWMANIMDVDARGVATLDANAPSSAGNQRVQWGFDCTTVINNALAELSADFRTPREAYLPGRYRLTQLVMPPHVVLRGSGWGNYGSPIGEANTVLQQLPGAQKSLVVFSSVGGDQFGAQWLGPVGLTHMVLAGPESNVRNLTPTIGSGFSLTNIEGANVIAGDGCEFAWLHAVGFPEDGFYVSGAVPLTLNHLRAFYNGGYGINYVPANPAATQMLHLLDYSADGNNLGAARFKDLSSYSNVTITAMKSESDTAAIASAIGMSFGGPNYQRECLIFEDCDDSPVVINGLSHVAGGSASTAAGPAIVFRHNNNSQKRPKLAFNAVYNRVLPRGVPEETQAVASDTVTLHDEIIGFDIPHTVSHGYWPPNALPTLADLNDELIAGQESCPRTLCGDPAVLQSGGMSVSFFAARKTETTTQVRISLTAPASGGDSGVTAAYIALFVIASDGGMTSVAMTANSKEILDSAGLKTVPWESGHKLLAGQRYGVGVSATFDSSTPPEISCNRVDELDATIPPRLCAYLPTAEGVPKSGYTAVEVREALAGIRPYAVVLP